MTRLFFLAVRAALLPRAHFVAENLALRQQLAVLHRQRPRAQITAGDRAFWVALRRVWSRWADALVIVKPETVVRWHRLGFAVYWGRKSRPRRQGRPAASREIRDLIATLATKNRTWGAPRVHAELLKLGFDVSERTVSRYMPRRPPELGAVKRWKTFLLNHREAIAGMDFFTVPTVRFELLYVFFIIDHARRRVLHVGVTAHPTADRVIQRLREAFPFDEVPGYLILDRDARFSASVRRTIETLGIEPCLTAFRSPWQNGVGERWVGSVRRERLDHVVVLNEAHLRRLLTEYVAYYHDDRPHLTLNKDPPSPRATSSRPSGGAQVVALPRLGGIHHRYEWRDAA
jgi:transposase InsO family protein